MPLADGVTFAGFTIVRMLGSGGMGEVYLARHPRLPRQDALKVLPVSVSADAEFRERFGREADLAATLWHPHIVGVHDRGEFDDRLWIAMDYVEGTDAAGLSREHYPYGMPTTDVVEVISAVAEALDYAHERRLLHRDVKPANILLTEAGNDGRRRILLADFGIARHADDVTGLTATNITIGSVSYTAPEQLMGDDLDGRADQYALAATAFHLLTGAPLFPHTNPAAVIGRHLSTPPPTVSASKPDLCRLDDVLAKALAKQPNDRYDNCQTFARALADADSGADEAIQTRGFSSPYSTGAAASEPTVHHHVPPTVVSNWGETQEHSDTSPDEPSPPVERPPTPVPAPPSPQGVYEERTTRSESVVSISRRTALIVGGIATLFAVGLVAFIGARLGQPPPAPPAAFPPAPPTAPPQSRSAPQDSLPTEPPNTPPPAPITQPPSAPPRTLTPPPSPRIPPRPPGDLGLRTPMSTPNCTGQWIVVLGNVTTPGLYPAGIQQLLDAHPGAYYLRTDQTCPSLRQATEEGNPIYTVFEPAGTTETAVCAAVHAAGGGAYGKRLDTTTDPGFVIHC